MACTARSLAAGIIFSLAAGSALGSERDDFEVGYQSDAGILTVKARAASLKALLEHIAGRTGIKIIVDPSINQTVTITVRRSSAEALAQILRRNNYALVYEGDGSNKRVSKVFILPEGNHTAEMLTPVTRPANAPSGIAATTYTAEQRQELERRKLLRASRKGPPRHERGSKKAAAKTAEAPAEQR